MNYEAIFHQVSLRCSRITAHSYSTSFSLGIRCLEKEFRDPIYAIYGFVRFADEIVDTLHDFDQLSLFERFRDDTHRAITEGISLNPILNSFQSVVRQYRIPPELYTTFLQSMEMDLNQTRYTREDFEKYVLGSAGVVGLMCLCVFSDGDESLYERLRPYAIRLGAAFQKTNFLRDLNTDYTQLGRCYFPGVEPNRLDDESKKKIEEQIDADFTSGYEGIQRLPHKVKLGLYVVYVYYYALFKKIRNKSPRAVMSHRIRIPAGRKMSILAYSILKHRLNLI